MLNIAIIGYVWPEPNSSAAGQNMLSIITSCLDAGFRVTFYTPATDSEHKADLDTLGVKSYTISINCSSFNQTIAALQPDVVIFDRYMTEEQFSWRVKESCPKALRVLNTEDLHSLRQARHEAVKSNGCALHVDLHTELAQREIAAILRCDITLIISQYEMDLLQQHYRVPGSQLHYHPLCVEQQEAVTPGYHERAHFVHIGNFRHAPNWDAVLQLKQHIWPAIRAKLPQAELHIYGAYPPKKATQLHNAKQGFLVKGWAESAKEVMMNARVLLAPIRFGAGIKGKVLDAMRCGTPSITTWVGAEGIVNEHSTWPGAICSAVLTDPCNIDDYVSSAVNLYTNEHTWEAASARCHTVLQQYRAQYSVSALTETLVATASNIDEHRKKHFLQAMLWHQTLNASKYMSQWIEAKNRL